MSKLKKCPKCQTDIPILATRCKHCGFNLKGPAPIPVPTVKSKNKTIMMGVALPPPPPSPPKSAKPAAKIKDTTDRLDWLPNVDDVEEISQLILIEEEPTSDTTDPISTSDMIEENDYSDLVEEASQVALNTTARKSSPPGKENSNALAIFLFKKILSNKTLGILEKKNVPSRLLNALNILKIIHAIIAAVIFWGAAGIIVSLCIFNQNNTVTEPAIVSTQPIKEPIDVSVQKNSVKKKNNMVRKESPASTIESDLKIGRECKALSDYPSFPWRDILDRALKSNGVDSVCGLFGSTPSSIAAAYKHLPVVGPSGDDWIKGGTFIEVFATGKADRNGPVMEFLFVGKKLYEIRLAYRASEKLDAKSLENFFEEKPKKRKDSAGRKITLFTDSDMQVAIEESKWYGRTLRTLVMRSRQIAESLSDEFELREKRERLLATAESLFSKWRFKGAVKKLDELIATAPTLGIFYSKKGLSLTRLEKFNQVLAVSKKLLEVSRDTRMHAEAHGLMAVAALFNGDKDQALAHFEDAAKLDPANNLFTMSAKELETGKYTTDRVALIAARMECLSKKKNKATPKGLLARGNFPTMQIYFDVLRGAKKDPKFNSLQKQYAKVECR